MRRMTVLALSLVSIVSAMGETSNKPLEVYQCVGKEGGALKKLLVERRKDTTTLSLSGNDLKLEEMENLVSKQLIEEKGDINQWKIQMRFKNKECQYSFDSTLHLNCNKKAEFVGNHSQIPVMDLEYQIGERKSEHKISLMDMNYELVSQAESLNGVLNIEEKTSNFKGHREDSLLNCVKVERATGSTTH